MHRRMALTTVGCLLLAACFPKPGVAPGPLSASSVANALQQWPGTSEEQLEQGRQLFLQNCNGCHDYPDLVAYPEQKWPAAARRMGNKADLPEVDTELVLHFILASRAQQAAAPGKAEEPR
jgi:hypothetical protein